MEKTFKIAVTYGGFLGKLIRWLGRVGRLDYWWNHILFVRFEDGIPTWTYESNIRGIMNHTFDEKRDLAEEHLWYIATDPMSAPEIEHLQGFCEGATGKWYALHQWLVIGWRILKDILLGPTYWQAMEAIPARTCISFVDAAGRSVRRPVSPFGSGGLPDDIERSPYWEEEEI